MTRIEKVTTTCYRDPSGKKCRRSDAVSDAGTLKKGYRRETGQSKKWYARIPDENGTVKRVALSTDRKVAEQILRKKLDEAERAKYGLGDPFEKFDKIPLGTHVQDFCNRLREKGDTPEHCRQVEAALLRAFQACGFNCLKDLCEDRFASHLAELQLPIEKGEPLDRRKTFFTLGEAARTLGISPTAVRALVSRHGLSATGNGRARRLPLATVEFLKQRSRRGRSVQTTNHLVTFAKAFGRFLKRRGRVAKNPFEDISKGNPETDRRHVRRALTETETQLLIRTTLGSKRGFRGLNGNDRAMLYAVAIYTGLRASALASLTPESFQLTQAPCSLILAARFNKNRKRQVQAIPASLVPKLRLYLAKKQANARIWDGTWASGHRGAEMLRQDLKEAGIPCFGHGPDGPNLVDFHSLRHTFVTLAAKDTDYRTAQLLAGHSSPKQTATYSHRNLNELALALQNFPDLFPNESQEGIRAGTEGGENQDLVCHRLATDRTTQGQFLTVDGTVGQEQATGQETTKPLEYQGFSQLVSLSDTRSQKRGRRGSNPQPPDRQSGTLTN